jgi:hypothetical protein
MADSLAQSELTFADRVTQHKEHVLRLGGNLVCTLTAIEGMQATGFLPTGESKVEDGVFNQAALAKLRQLRNWFTTNGLHKNNDRKRWELRVQRMHLRSACYVLDFLEE